MGLPCAFAAASGANRQAPHRRPQGPQRDLMPVGRSASLIRLLPDRLAAASGTLGERGLAKDPSSPSGLGIYDGEGGGGGGGHGFHADGGEKRGGRAPIERGGEAGE